MPLPPPPSPLILFEILHHARNILVDYDAGRRIGLLRRCELLLEATTDLHAHLYLCPTEGLRSLYAAVMDAEQRVLAIEHVLLRRCPRSRT
jgi:hypothetical protein